MCGIAGLIAGRTGTRLAGARKMIERLSHRGPDSEGHWEQDGVYFGHKRLAVVDLTAAGHQPMLSADGHHAVTYNGEIYNHLDLRAALLREKKVKWRGHSDTETLVEAIAHWGVAAVLPKLNGMFAFGHWEMRAQELTLARDPFGEKPLLYGLQDGMFGFASELGALTSVRALRGEVDRAAVAAYLREGYVPAAHSIIAGVKKLPPGCMLQWKRGAAPVVTPYFHLHQVAEAGLANKFTDDDAALEELDALFKDAVRVRLMSDVPLGAFLSGGIDSSLVVAYMQELLSKPVHTFCIGHTDKSVDEAEHASAVARHLGTRHETLLLTDAMALDAAQRMGEIYDEPFSDASQVPTFLVSQFARKKVTMALSGDGCDELFSGYARHVLAQKAWASMKRIPMRHSLAKLVPHLPDFVVGAAAKVLSPLVPQGVNPESLRRKLRHSSHLLRAENAEEIFSSYLARWRQPLSLMKDGTEIAESWAPQKPAFTDSLDQFVWSDTVNYLPGDILTKVDRASMAVSLETRIPALDPRIAVFAWRLPQHMRWRDGRGKWILRQLLYKKVPQDLVDRPKRGFAVPLDTWLRGPLKTWAEDLLSEARLKRDGLLNVQEVRRIWAGFQNDAAGVTGTHIWTLLMLQSWINAQGL
ncbi:asparagine synthase (glutamine-hydrolyzing) [Aestuariivirga litoralis]|uniref:asparagine synthase (glutamine-hydrolyzing) n=1 Tax=Aestuariivirga litoralis TaxID=2650924 RepID=UPI0018C6B222|nr:asparagine synthase (glutamine-hydrolyzing) [Aestuariivirga litoralis]MBG1233237.1 asparagine synthase (glutamine-hydrolyzing) [Aestuariivirga litoralis]